jgi:surface protein
MSIFKNNKKVIALYKGATPIRKVFKGSQLVFGSEGGGESHSDFELVLTALGDDIVINNKYIRITTNNTIDNGNGTYTYVADASIFGFGGANDNYSEAFNGCPNLIEVGYLYFPDTIVDCAEMFSNCTKLQKINAEGWKVSHLTQSAKVKSMLSNCGSLTLIVLGQVDSITYDWWYQRLVDAGLENQVTIEYEII